MTIRMTTKVCSSSAISVAEFYDALLPWTKAHGVTFPTPKCPKIGIAISGGVDSMALAALCSALKTYPPAKQRFDFQFTPFIIDHKARQESSEEVERVQQRLRDLGFDPHIRSLTWPDPVSPLNLPDFETQARRLRYQTLGSACRDLMVRSLLLAHHDDDQAETVLMRLASGAKGLGLKGMQFRTRIPECWGMHGVDRSGQREFDILKLHIEEEKDPSSSEVRNLRELLARPDVFEKGGIEIIRPLLGFSKERLIETCRARGLLWEDDKTNEDTWRTLRNNVRALLRSAKLPQALQKDSMLQLAERTNTASEDQMATNTKIANCCDVLLFDARCGGLIIRFPRAMGTMTPIQSPKLNLRVHKRNIRRTAVLLLQKFALSVSPQEEIPLQSLVQAALSIFPNLNDGDTAAGGSPQVTVFTAGGVQFQRLHCPLAVARSVLDPAISGICEDLDPVFVWKLTRQPFSKIPLSFRVQPISHEEFPNANNVPSWSSWKLWDGRYWIRILNRSRQPVIVRSFQPSDLQYLRSVLSRQRYKQFHRFLHLTAPEKVRWTLLAIAAIGGEYSSLGRLLALPTLGQAGTFTVDDADGTRKVEWQIRYKSVSLGYRLSYDGSRKLNRNRDLITSWHD